MSSGNDFSRILSVINVLTEQVSKLTEQVSKLEQKIDKQGKEFDVLIEDTKFRIEQVLCLNSNDKPIKKKDVKKTTDTELKEKPEKKKKVKSINNWFFDVFENNKSLIKEFYTDDELKKANAIYDDDIKNKAPKTSKKNNSRDRAIARILWGQVLTDETKGKLRTFKLNLENEQAKQENEDIVEDVN